MKRFELCPIDTGAVVFDIVKLSDGWRKAKQIFTERGYRGKFLLLENYDNSGNTIVHRININL